MDQRNGIYLKIYLLEQLQCHGTLAYEWILKQAKAMGIHGGSVFRSIAGFGRHGLQESHFYELAGHLPVEVVFAISVEEADLLIDELNREGLSLFYVKMPVEYGFLNGDRTPRKE